jgi:phenylacetic acid degradation operon negative regulatory protein
MAADSTRTVLFGIFVVAGRPLTTGQVVGLAGPLGLSATNVKSHLTRMVADGTLRRSGVRRFGRYRPAARQRQVIEALAARLERHPEERWDGRWLMLALRMPAGRSRRDRLRASLWFDGFRPWGPEAFVRPAWPERWALDRARRYLAETSGLCAHGTLLGNVDLNVVRKLYAVDALDREARRLARQTAATRVRTQSPAEAFAARLDVGGRVARLVGHDPRLPPAVWGVRTGMRDLVRAYRRFEKQVAPLAERFVNDVLHGQLRERS